MKIFIVVALSIGAPLGVPAGPFRVQVAAPSDAGETALARPRALLREGRQACDDGDYVSARSRVAEAIDLSLASPGAGENRAWMELTNELGVFALAVGESRAAERAFGAVVQTLARTLPDDHADLQTVRGNLADALRQIGDLQGARTLQERILEVLSRTLPSDHPELQWARGNLADTLFQLGDLQRARTLQEKVLEVQSSTLPDDHPELQTARGNLARTLSMLGDLRGAQILQEKVLEVRSRTLPDDHLELQVARNNLAATRCQLGDLQGARVLQEKVLEVLSRTLADDHPHMQSARGNLAVTLFELGDLQGARMLEEKVLEMLSRTLPDDHPSLQSARGNLARTLGRVGDLQSARALQEKVVEILSRTLPGDHPELQTARGNLAATLYEVGDLQGARSLEERVLEVRLRTLRDDHPSVQTARGNLARTLCRIGDLRGARALQERVLEILSRTLPDEHPNVQRARGSLAVTLRQLGELDAARTLQAAALENLSRALPDDHPELQTARGNLGVTLSRFGDLRGARELQEKALEVGSRTLPDDHPQLQEARGNLAATLYELGDLQGARMLEEKVLEIVSRTLPDDHPSVQMARGNLGSTLCQLGDHRSALTLQEKVIEIFSRTLPDDHPELQTARGNLAWTMYLLGDVQGARGLQEKVLEVLSRALPEDHPALQTARNNLAGTRAQLGDLQGARTLREKVLEILSRTFPAEHPYLQATRVDLALTIYRLVANRRASAVARGDVTPPRDDESDRATLSALLGAYCRGLTRASFSAIADASSREAESRVAWMNPDIGLAISFAGGLGLFAPAPDWEQLAFFASESLRGAALASARLARAARGDAEYAALRFRVRKASEALARLVHNGASADEFARARGDIESAEREIVRRAARLSGGEVRVIEADFGSLAARVREGEAFVAFRRYARRSVELSQPPRWSSVASFCAFVLRAPGTAGSAAREALVRIDLGPIAPIEAAVAEWRASITGSGGLARGATVVDSATPRRESTGEEIRMLVLDPLREALGGARTIVVVPDDVLLAVPFEALRAGPEWSDGDAELPLGAALRIEYRSSLLELLGDEAPPSGEPVLLTLGNAAFDGGPLAYEEPDAEAAVATASTGRPATAAGALRGTAWEAGFATLPGTRAEVREIGGHFESVFGKNQALFQLERQKAARDNLFALAPRARFLHVATHGWFAPESIRSWHDAEPLDSQSGLETRMSAGERVRGMSPMLLCGLALAGASLPAGATGQIPGLITAEELSTLDLANCELAVLSACDTNVGVRRAGQGVASLQRALHMAGARSVITSLWKVPDEATKELMVDFYRRLWNKESPKEKAVALWEAKMKLRDAKDERGRPKYGTRDWAAWVLTGDPR